MRSIELKYTPLRAIAVGAVLLAAGLAVGWALPVVELVLEREPAVQPTTRPVAAARPRVNGTATWKALGLVKIHREELEGVTEAAVRSGLGYSPRGTSQSYRAFALTTATGTLDLWRDSRFDPRRAERVNRFLAGDDPRHKVVHRRWPYFLGSWAAVLLGLWIALRGAVHPLIVGRTTTPRL
ncbi:MAG TPA: hypothetical protein VF017_03850 [Thermoanaerobaculia bacterium]|nr:hypothetical protein [Thermoanaerobaculia bacterium]